MYSLNHEAIYAKICSQEIAKLTTPLPWTTMQGMECALSMRNGYWIFIIHETSSNWFIRIWSHSPLNPKKSIYLRPEYVWHGCRIFWKNMWSLSLMMRCWKWWRPARTLAHWFLIFWVSSMTIPQNQVVFAATGMWPVVLDISYVSRTKSQYCP